MKPLFVIHSVLRGICIVLICGLVLRLTGCAVAHAMPPLAPPLLAQPLWATNYLVTTSPASGPPITGIAFFQATPEATDWTNAFSVATATNNGAQVASALIVTPVGQTNFFRANSTNNQNGASSDWIIITNVPKPGVNIIMLPTPNGLEVRKS